jgi:hypothetical protein
MMVDHEELDRELNEALDSLRDVPLPDEGRQAAQRAVFLATARQQRRLAQSPARPARSPGFLRPAPALSRRWAVAGVITAIVLAMLISSGGVIYAADGAVPGDPLYGVDQAVESARLGLTHRPESVLKLLLALAEERLTEAEELAAQQDEGNLDLALDNYGAAVSSLAQTLGTVEGADTASLTAALDNTISSHEGRLTRLLGPAVAEADGDEGEEEQQEEEGNDYCVGADPHPTANRLAEAYGATYEDIMGWFCYDGYGMGEIEHALQTSAVTGLSVDEVFALKAELGGWGEVWQELGLIGSTDDDSEELTEEEEEELAYCVGVDPHPVAQRLAETYDVAYEDIMTWFCEGRYGLGEIMHALQTGSDEEGNTPEELLQMKTDMGGWGQVWQELGLIGKPDDKPDKEPKIKPEKPEKPVKVKPEKKEKPEKKAKP